MVEENYEIQSFQILQIYSKVNVFFTVIEKILKFSLSKYYKLTLKKLVLERDPPSDVFQVLLVVGKMILARS